MTDGGRVLWLGKASALLSCANGRVHPEFFLIFRSLTLSRGEAQHKSEHRPSADVVQVRFVAFNHDQKRLGRTITRTLAAGTTAGAVGSRGTFETVLELLDLHPQLLG